MLKMIVNAIVNFFRRKTSSSILCNWCGNESVKMIRSECVIDPMGETNLL